MFKRFVPIFKRPAVFVDCETTDVRAGDEDGEMLEIAIADIHGNSLFESKILPQHIETAAPKALEMNGYDKEVWATEAVPFHIVAEEIANHLRGVRWIGQNPRFDLEFVMYELRRAGASTKGVSYHTFDTATLVEEHLTPPCDSVSLDWACGALAISNEGAHTAMADVQRCRRVYLKLKRATILHRLWWRIASLWRLKGKRDYLRMKDFSFVCKEIDRLHQIENPDDEDKLALIAMQSERDTQFSSMPPRQHLEANEVINNPL